MNDKLRIVQLVMINWSFHERSTIRIDGATAIVGDNGTGKSALLDMVQVAYAGGKPAGVKLNPGAQKSQKGGRTIGEYALGAVEDRLLRTSAISYICLGFADAVGKKFTIGLSIAATSGAASTTYSIEDRFIAPGVLLEDEDFLDTNGAPRLWALQKPILEKMCADKAGPGRKRGLACYPRSSEQYLLDHLSLASNGRFSHDGTELLRALSNALAFKDQINSASEFVRTFLLSSDPIDVERIRRSAGTYEEINQDIERLEAELDLLSKMRDVAMAFIEAIEKHDLAVAGKARAEALRALAALNAQRLTLKKKQIELAGDVREAEKYVTEIAAADRDLETLNHLYGLDSAKERLRSAEKDLEILVSRRDQARDQLKPYVSIRAAASELHALLAAAGVEGAEEAARVASLPVEATEDPTLAGLAILDLSGKLEAIGAGLAALERELSGKASALDREAKEKFADAELARQNGRFITQESLDLVNELKARGMNPRLLCSVIEVSDPAWREAAEARLGRDREAVIVDPEHCRDAILYYRDNRRRFQRNASVVNTAKERFRDGEADGNSLASVIATKDPLARAFIARRLGRIRLAETQEELERPGAAIMKDCTFDDGLVVRTLTSDHPKIGAAGASAVAILAEAARRAATAHDEAEREAAAIRFASKRHFSLSEVIKSGFDVTALAESHLEFEDKIEQQKGVVDQLKQEDDKGLAKEVRAAKDRLDRLRKDAKELDGRIADTRRDIGEATKIINNPDPTVPGSAAGARECSTRYSERRPLVAWYKFRPAFNALLEGADGNFRAAAQRAEAEAKANDATRAEKFNEFQALLNRHKSSYDSSVDFSHQDPIAGKLLPWVEARIAAIETTDLISRRQELAVAAEQVKRFLQEDFVHRVSDRAKQVKSTIREINRILAEHELHRETYEFDAKLDPYYEPIVAFAEKANEDDAYIDGVLQGRGHGSDREVYERIRSLVLGQDTSVGASFAARTAAREQEIERLADYRNWYKFGLDMINVKSGHRTRFDHRVVKGSGGEIQAPFYVIMAVAISAIHHGRARAEVTYDGLVLLDEAFSKLSPANARTCMDFFRQVSLQVIIAAPGGKRAVIDASCDTVLDLIRDEDIVYIEREIIGPRLRDETIAADPDTYSMEDLRRFVVQSGASNSTKSPSDSGDAAELDAAE